MSLQESELRVLQDRLGYEFKDKRLLERSLTHPSYLFSNPGEAHNQRLEFLGDAVLGMILAEILFKTLPDEREGVLTRNRSMLARGEQLSRLARELHLGRFIRLGEAEDQQGGRSRDSILEDVLEAIVGAIYLDGGLEAVRAVVGKIYGSIDKRLETHLESHNPKGRLQELLQPTLGNDSIQYKVTEESGPDHDKEFTVEVWISGKCRGTGQGSSKKLAEEEAARSALACIESDTPS